MVLLFIINHKLIKTEIYMKYIKISFAAILILSCGTENTITYEISISIDPPFAGTVVSNPNQTVVDKGTSFSLKAFANEGWIFNSWSGDMSSTVNPLSLSLDSDKTIIANFSAKSYPLAIEVNGHGTVSEEIIALPKADEYVHGTIVKLTAEPDEGWIFVEWNGDASGTDNSIIIEVLEKKNITVIFSQISEEFMFGADLSYVNQILDYGGIYKFNNVITDPYSIFSELGTKTVRFRLFKDPIWTKEIYGESGAQLYNDLLDVTLAIKRAKQYDMGILLDYHYSDIWADPGKQEVPKSWENLSFEEIADSIYQYTYQTLIHLYKEEALPEMVQIGNENNCGLVHPYANVCEANNWEKLGVLLNQGINAVRKVETDTGHQIKVVLHVAQPENVDTWFQKIISIGGVSDFDVIGFSYYPKWSDVSLERISNFVANFKTTYQREVMILETAYPWTLSYADNYRNILGADYLIEGYEATVEGQRQFMIDLVKEVLDGGGSGVFYWEPAWITSNMKDLWGTGSSWENNTLFDFEGNAHAGFDFMMYNY